MADLLNPHMQTERWLIREDRKYDRNHFWIKIEDRSAYIGLTDYGQWVIGDILYLDLSPEDASIAMGEKFGSVESGKWVGNLISPINGRVLENNPGVVTDPRQINVDPYGTGWMMRVALESGSEIESLIDPMAYAAWVNDQDKQDDRD